MNLCVGQGTVHTAQVTDASSSKDKPRPRRKPANTLSWTGEITDWGYRSGDERGHSAGYAAYQHYWWDEACQARFDALWAKEADDVADDLADRYRFYWPWMMGPALATAAPVVAERIMQFSMDPSRPGPAYIPLNPNAMYDYIAEWGSFHVVRRRRTWEEPMYVVCPHCP